MSRPPRENSTEGENEDLLSNPDRNCEEYTRVIFKRSLYHVSIQQKTCGSRNNEDYQCDRYCRKPDKHPMNSKQGHNQTASNEKDQRKQNTISRSSSKKNMLGKGTSEQRSNPSPFVERKIYRETDLVFDKRDFLYRDIPKNVRNMIQIDDVGLYSVTDMRTADQISDFISRLDGLKKDDIVITDATSCTGGNTFSFSKKFKTVHAVELDSNRFTMLRHNLDVLKCTNVHFYHENYVLLINRLEQDVVFLDPPWGGPSYKDQEKVDLYLGDVPLHQVCEDLKTKAKYVIIKAPLNLNYEKFQSNISGNINRHFEFRKMLLIVVDYRHHREPVQMKIHNCPPSSSPNCSKSKSSQYLC